MKEHSQIEDMRAAVRGDIERARKRLRSTPASPPEPEPQRAPEEQKPQNGLLSFFRRRD